MDKTKFTEWRRLFVKGLGSMEYMLAVTTLAMISLCSTLPARAQVTDARTRKITDPEVLQSMGFARNAGNVYMDNSAGFAVTSGDEKIAAPQATPTTGTDFSAISAKEFIGRIDTTGTQWRYDGGPNCCVDLSRAGTEQFADAQFEVPTGATLDFFRFWAFDNDPSDLAFFVFEVCQPAFAAGAPVTTLIANTTTSGTPGNTTGLVALGSRLVDNSGCTYLARVRFDAASTNLALQKVRLQFTR